MLPTQIESFAWAALTPPTGLPLFTGSTVAVTGSPTLNERRLQPRFTMSGGLLVSTTQFRTVPFASLTSNFRKQCGLDQTHSVTVPFISSFFPVSNVAAPW
jgi:hypothetical protein